MKKRILINVSTNALSGGLIVALDYIRHLIDMQKFELTIVAPPIKAFRSFENSCQMHYVPRLLLKRQFRLYTDFFWLPGVIQKLDPQLVFSITNLPAITKYPQLFLHDNPFVTETDWSIIPLSFKTRCEHKLRRWFFLQRIRYINHFIVQTRFEKEKLLLLLRKPIPVTIMEPFLPVHLKQYTATKSQLVFATDSVLRIIYPARFFEHKNFELILNAGRIIHDKKIKVQILLTLDSRDNIKAKQFLQKIAPYTSSIKNLGRLKPSEIPAAISACDAVVLPSLLETYGLNCIEAWYCNRPLFIANLPYARQNCGETAIYFDANNAEDFLSEVHQLFSDSQRMNTILDKGSERLKELPSPGSLEILIDTLLL